MLGIQMFMMWQTESQKVCTLFCAAFLMLTLGVFLSAAFLEGAALPDPLTLSQTASEMLTVRDRPTE